MAAVLGLFVVVVPGSGTPVQAAPAAAGAPQETAPLELTIGEMTPSVLGRKGPITISGTVTNVSDETWRSVDVYPFASWNSASPRAATTAEELAAEMELPVDGYAGDRWTTLDNYEPNSLDLEPGDTLPYSVRITAEQVRQATGSGVYWIGVHALGQSDSVPSDAFADGRARTFIPLVSGPHETVPTALVLSMRAKLSRGPEGALQPFDHWADRIAPGGRLDRLVQFGAGSTIPVSWLVDPAVVDAVRQLEAGNRGRSLSSNLPESGEGTGEESGSASPSGSESGTPSTDPDPSTPPDDGESDDLTPAELAAARDATRFLDQAGDAMAGQDLLLLPYGDLDVAAAAELGPEWIERAVERSGTTLGPWNLTGRPALAPPDGLLDEATLEDLSADTVPIVTDRALPETERERQSALVEVQGRSLVVADDSVRRGGPGPNRSLAPVPMRQQILAEGALRALGDGDPLITMLPSRWTAPLSTTETSAFFAGLDVGWLAPGTLSDIESGRPEPARLEERHERTLPRLEPDNFSTAQDLVDAGALLDEVLYRNDTVGDEVAGQALTGLSYFAGRTPERSRVSAERSREWIDDELDKVEIQPTSVLLSSETGSFNVTLVNGLDVPVEVQVRSRSDDDVRIAPSRALQLQAGDRTTQLMQASTTKLGSHRVLLEVTTTDGTPLGPEAVLPVRANQVSRVIWVVIGIGGFLLFGTILLRITRRVRDYRRTRGEPAG